LQLAKLAIDQTKKYVEKYHGRETWLIGVEFSKTYRNISRFEWEKAGKNGNN
jgi:hypothetical protein